MLQILDRNELVSSPLGWEFEGIQHGSSNVCFIIVAALPGTGPRLHAHPYEEIFIVQEGEATFTVGEETRVIQAGQIVVAPAHLPHKFVNSGQGLLRQVDIHLSPEFVTDWLE